MDFDRDPVETIRFPDKDYTARKQHKCWECGGTIEPGMRYRVSKYVIDREFQVAKAHLDPGTCGVARSKMND
jgi:hypothetical protein